MEIGLYTFGEMSPDPLTGETILLAQVTNDLYDERDQVVAYLNQFGARILPLRLLPPSMKNSCRCPRLTR